MVAAMIVVVGRDECEAKEGGRRPPSPILAEEGSASAGLPSYTHSLASIMHSITTALRTLSLTSRRSITTSATRWQEQATAAETAAAAPTAWTPQTQRTGVLARKLGMTALWQEGIRVPVTVLHVSPARNPPSFPSFLPLPTPVALHCTTQLDDVQVLSTNEYPATCTTPAHSSVILGCSPRKEKTTNNSLLGQFRQAGIKPKMRVVEFPVTADAVVPAGEPPPRAADDRSCNAEPSRFFRCRDHHLVRPLCARTAR